MMIIYDKLETGFFKSKVHQTKLHTTQLYTVDFVRTSFKNFESLKIKVNKILTPGVLHLSSETLGIYACTH